LTYVYEVDAVETLESESQAFPSDEQVVSLSPGKTETVDDEVLPYEARKKESGARIPKSETKDESDVRSPNSGVRDAESQAASSKTDN
jgi:hypothetical protein